MKTIKINETARIEMIPDNYVLQYYKEGKTREGETKYEWITDGYFPDLVLLAMEYIKNAPQATSEAIGDIEKLIKVIKTAEVDIKRILRKKL